MKRIARGIGIFVLVVLIAAVVVPFLIDANQFRPALERQLTAALGRQVTIGDLKVSLFSGGVSASDLAIADDPAFSRNAFLRAQRLSVGVKLLPLLVSRKLEVTGIAIERPQIEVVETPAGAFNFSSMGAGKRTPPAPPADAPGASAMPEVSIARIRISGGRLAWRKTGSSPQVVEDLNLEIRDFAANAAFPFSLSATLPGGGTLKLDGTMGPPAAGELADTPFRAKLSLAHLDLARSGLLEGASGISGIASLDGTAESKNGTIETTGKLKAERLTLAKGGVPSQRPVEVDVALAHHLAKQSGEVQRMAIRLGDAAAILSGTYSLEREPATVNLKLTASAVPLAQLAAFLPSLNVALPSGASIEQGTADVNLTSQGPLNALVTRGTMGAANVRVAKYDLASKLRVLHAFTGIKAQPHTFIQLLRAKVQNTAAGTALDDVQFAVASVGAIAGAGTISPSHALDFKMRAVMGDGGIAALAGNRGIPFTIQGTSEDPSIRPDVKGMVSEKLNQVTGGQSPAAAATGLLKGLLGGKKKQP